MSGELVDSEMVEEGEEEVCVCDVRLHEHGGDLTISKSRP